MDLQRLISDLSAPEEETWRPAWNACKELGGVGGDALVAELLDENSPLDWARAGTLLRQLGDPAFCAVRDAVAADLPQEPARRARWTFGGFSGEHWDRLLESLDHPSPAVRAGAALCLQRMGQEALPASGALIRLLGDPDADVRKRAAWALEEFGPGVLDELREVRRSGPAAYRPAAFEVIMNIAGPGALSPEDQKLWRRYLRAKAAADRPQGIWENSCFAVPGGDQEGILAALEFSDPGPMYFELGLAVAAGAWWTAPPVEHPDRAEAFITPELDGWTLIVSGWCYPAWDEQWYAQTRDALRRLSARFGVAWGFAGRGYAGTAAWACAKDGDIVWEREVTDDDEWGEDDPAEGIDTDEPLGIDPTELTEATPMRGTGLRALTPYGRDAPRREGLEPAAN
ncbi:HEAT repeat domain-containing protein [Actinomadura sp. NBRC 104425]|uniref:HEAT repeat domain-containing protein n=1 Tax=Actinomadura sp. NBRC 104425 TaxID=3032204 RepID=UPI002556FEC4|nr:HEAT repeat domain-containing protein [Actinomadura sp. NBRC 104425]